MSYSLLLLLLLLVTLHLAPVHIILCSVAPAEYPSTIQFKASPIIMCYQLWTKHPHRGIGHAA
jgi:hypothetical protein